MRNLAIALLLSALGIGCRGSENGSGETGGTFVIAVPDPVILLPPLTNTSQGRLVTDQIFERLAELPTTAGGPYQPRLAASWEFAPDSLSIVFHLNPKAKWHDGAPVRASDVAFTYRISSDSTSGSPIVGDIHDIDSVTVRDSLSPVFWFHRKAPSQLFTATYQMFILPEHLLKDVKPADLRTAPFGHNPVGSGRFRFVSWQPNQRLELIADTANYRGRPALDRIVLAIAPDANAAMTKVMSGEADFYEVLSPEAYADVGKRPELQRLPYSNLQYGFLLFNELDRKNPKAPHPLFGDRPLRRALSMSLDRVSMVKNVFGDSLGLVGTGPAPRALPFSDSTVKELHYGPEESARLLDSLGWKKGADGIRAKNGRPLAFTLAVPSSSQTRVKLAVLLQEQFKQAGAKVDIEQIDFGTYQARMAKHDFDTGINVVSTDPVPQAVLGSWGSASADAGSNYGGYRSATFDALIDSGSSASDPAKMKSYLHKAYQTIVDDAPAVWLYERRLVAVAHKRIRPAEMRFDAWWANLADWKIPPNERIARDKIGLKAASN